MYVLDLSSRYHEGSWAVRIRPGSPNRQGHRCNEKRRYFETSILKDGSLSNYLNSEDNEFIRGICEVKVSDTGHTSFAAGVLELLRYERSSRVNPIMDHKLFKSFLKSQELDLWGIMAVLGYSSCNIQSMYDSLIGIGNHGDIPYYLASGLTDVLIKTTHGYTNEHYYPQDERIAAAIEAGALELTLEFLLRFKDLELTLEFLFEDYHDSLAETVRLFLLSAKSVSFQPATAKAISYRRESGSLGQKSLGMAIYDFRTEVSESPSKYAALLEIYGILYSMAAMDKLHFSDEDEDENIGEAVVRIVYALKSEIVLNATAMGLDVHDCHVVVDLTGKDIFVNTRSNIERVNMMLLNSAKKRAVCHC
mmetsp:Transcript_38677/g.92532  ORF Transcript_38677/g.92532 Transcript_38677/m.92532 type:complete len:364 (+) Transcript_38677:830-1921(+)